MFLGYQEDNLSFVAETREELENLPCVSLSRIEETNEPVKLVGGQYKIGKDNIIEGLATIVRENRDSVLVSVVDPVVMNPLRWSDMPEAKQKEYTDYRRYLLDIPQSKEFPCDKNFNELKVMTMEEWKESLK